MDVVISSVAFSPEGIEISFMSLPDDVRSDGQLVATRTYAIDRGHPTYGNDVVEITAAVIDLIEDVHRGFMDEPIAYEPTGKDAPEDDELGMGE